MNVDPEIKKLQDSIQRSKTQRAKAASMDEKILDGVRLFDQVRERIKAGIRVAHPEWAEDAIHQEFLAILKKQRTREEKNIYSVVGQLNDDSSVTPAN
jgi:recombinational DNA repair ATPase RecF